MIQPLLLNTSKRFISSHKKYLASYTILKVRNKSTPQDIRDNFLKLSKIYHPDNSRTGNHDRFLRVKEAYDQIKDAPLLNNYKLSRSHILNDEDSDLSHKAHVEYRQQSNNQVINAKHVPIYENQIYQINILAKIKSMFMKPSHKTKKKYNLEDDSF